MPRNGGQPHKYASTHRRSPVSKNRSRLHAPDTRPRGRMALARRVFKNRSRLHVPDTPPRGRMAPARRAAASTRRRPLTSRVRHVHQLTAIIFCRLAPSLLHHSANAGHCNRSAEASCSHCSVVACGCTGCHSVHGGEARSTPKGSLCRGQHACARTARRICTPTSTLPAFACTRMRGHTIVSPELTQIGIKKGSKSASFCYESCFEAHPQMMPPPVSPLVNWP